MVLHCWHKVLLYVTKPPGAGRGFKVVCTARSSVTVCWPARGKDLSHLIPAPGTSGRRSSGVLARGGDGSGAGFLRALPRHPLQHRVGEGGGRVNLLRLNPR